MDKVKEYIAIQAKLESLYKKQIELFEQLNKQELEELKQEHPDTYFNILAIQHYKKTGRRLVKLPDDPWKGPVLVKAS